MILMLHCLVFTVMTSNGFDLTNNADTRRNFDVSKIALKYIDLAKVFELLKNVLGEQI